MWAALVQLIAGSQIVVRRTCGLVEVEPTAELDGASRPTPQIQDPLALAIPASGTEHIGAVGEQRPEFIANAVLEFDQLDAITYGLAVLATHAGIVA